VSKTSKQTLDKMMSTRALFLLAVTLAVSSRALAGTHETKDGVKISTGITWDSVREDEEVSQVDHMQLSDAQSARRDL